MPTWAWIIVVLVSFYAGFWIAAILANRRIEEAEMDKAYSAAWKE